MDLVLPIGLTGFFTPGAFAKRGYAPVRVFCAVALILMISALLLSSSRGGWLGALMACVVLTSLWSKSDGPHRVQRIAGIAAWMSLGLLVLLVLLLVGPGGRTQTDARLEETVTQNSIVSRLQPAKVSLKIVRDFPLFGVGLGCWPEVFPHYAEPPWSPTFWNATHNDYVQSATETGLIGFGFLAWFFVVTLRRIRHCTRPVEPNVRLLVAGCLAGISAAAVHEFFDFPLQIPANALLFTILLGLTVRMTKSESQAADTSTMQRLVCGLGLVSAFALIAAATIQGKVPYPYDLTRPATAAQAYSLENAHPANASVHLMLIGALGEESPVKYRTRILRAALWLEPTNPFARDLYVQTLLRSDDRKEALSEMSRSVFYAPRLDSHFYLEPRIIPWLLASEQKAVENGFRAAVADRFDGALQNLASYYDTLGNFRAKAKLYSEGALQESDRGLRASYFVDAGIAYAKTKDLAQAKVSFHSASAMAPKDSAAYDELILLVFAPQNNLSAAKVTLAQGIQSGADPFKLYTTFGSMAQTAHDYSEAEAAFQTAAELEPSSLEALLRIGALELAINRFDRAANWLQQATRVDPLSAEAFFELGRANEGAYEYFAADRAYQRALALAPADDRFKTYYAAFRQKLARNRSDRLEP